MNAKAYAASLSVLFISRSDLEAKLVFFSDTVADFAQYASHTLLSGVFVCKYSLLSLPLEVMKKFVICLLTVVAVALSCKKEETVSVGVVPSSATLSYKGGMLEAQLTCNAGWRVKLDSTFEYSKSIVVTPDTAWGDHLVKISIPENDRYDIRNIRITFSASNGSSNASAKLVVSQEPRNFVACDPEYLTIGEAGGGVRFDIVSNDEWEFDGQSLIDEGVISDFFPVSGKFNAAAGVTVSPNTTGDPRLIDIPIVLRSDREIGCVVSIFQMAEGVK